jgi:hypothetical protein
MKHLIVTLLVASTLSPSLSWAAKTVSQPVSQPVNEESATVVALGKGQVAPFSGVLFNSSATASVIVEYTTSAESTAIQVRRATADAEAQKNKAVEDLNAQCRREKTELNASVVSLEDILRLKQEENDALRKQVADAPDRLTWLGIGFAGGLVFTLATVFATSSLTK